MERIDDGISKVVALGKRQPSQRDPTVLGHVHVPFVRHVVALLMQEEGILVMLEAKKVKSRRNPPQSTGFWVSKP